MRTNVDDRYIEIKGSPSSRATEIDCMLNSFFHRPSFSKSPACFARRIEETGKETGRGRRFAWVGRLVERSPSALFPRSSINNLRALRPLRPGLGQRRFLSVLPPPLSCTASWAASLCCGWAATDDDGDEGCCVVLMQPAALLPRPSARRYRHGIPEPEKH